MRKKKHCFPAALCVIGLLTGTQGMSALASDTFSFAQLDGLTFAFSSGAGAWQTLLTIYDNGSFEGHYSDSDMGDSGEGYPNGTVYLCDFYGQFTDPVQVNDYTYSVEISEIETVQEAGTSEILEGVRYVYSEPYGLDGAEEILFYLPGAPLDELPSAYLSWVGYYDLSAAEETALPFTGLYNVAAESGFSSYETTQTTSGISEELAAIEAQAVELENRLNEGALSQSELNQAAQELYTLWDNELNAIWARLMELLPENEAAQLTEEELAWIQEKETAVEAAGADVEGGTLEPLVEYSTAARLTRERVYELAALLGYTGLADYELEPDTAYTLDLDGDGAEEQFSFSSSTLENDGASQAILELSVNGQVVWSQTDPYQSYRWRVSRCPIEDGSVYLVACSISDNDWTNFALVLKKTGDSFQVLADLNELTRKSAEASEKLLSSWSRVSGVTAVQGNTFTLTWSETLMSTGIVSVPVTYTIAEGQVTQTDTIVSLDEQKTWTPWKAFDVMTEPGGETVLFQAAPGETVSLTGLTSISGRSWIRCRNSQGQEGWYPDPEEYISEAAADGSWLSGYFKEAMFAG